MLIRCRIQQHVLKVKDRRIYLSRPIDRPGVDVLLKVGQRHLTNQCKQTLHIFTFNWIQKLATSETSSHCFGNEVCSTGVSVFLIRFQFRCIKSSCFYKMQHLSYLFLARTVNLYLKFKDLKRKYPYFKIIL